MALKTLPPLIYVLGAFGCAGGALGARHAIAVAVENTVPHDQYVTNVREENQLMLEHIVPNDQLERYSVREADARWGRRNAALPLAAVGFILGTLLFFGGLSAMRGQAWGYSAWQLVAVVSVPYQFLATVLAIATAHDLTRAFADVPAAAMMLVAKVEVVTLWEILRCGLAILYFAVCVIYLRSPRVRGLFSDGRAGTPPSAA